MSRFMLPQKWVIFNFALSFDGLCFGPQNNTICIYFEIRSTQLPTLEPKNGVGIGLSM